ncbi:phosphoenolpyruvate carboxylase [Dokdonia sinensis]|uniref:Phosphoenolpyruvate carboxylase n=1 Tax=Dokdonia sinensis TaxID=2479847 RepID=A0A3M0GE90_9FLAO|nr:phosphoenolpyruvate carboxylase [Dokdonia sinensis]RMB59469.1 phosphoenolpyruvate carboxylase [Dokdonia sinensis]
MSRLPKVERFNTNVKAKYDVYNGIFMTLPFDEVTNTGVLLPLFHSICKKGYAENKNPTEIIGYFFERYMRDTTVEERNDLLFRFIQYIERQVVLFDAIEDASYRVVNNMDGRGTLRNIKEEAEALGKKEELISYLNKFKIRPVLTAHPTQFYPGVVLGIINDLSEAIRQNNLDDIRTLLAQLGKTPFFKKEKPTPYDEAVSLIWYLENVFYHSAGHIYDYLHTHLIQDESFDNTVIDLGFWPGGDRDGNPFVTTEITLKVARRLRSSVLRNYYRELRAVRRRITFVGTEAPLAKLEADLYEAIFETGAVKITQDSILKTLKEVRSLVKEKHQSLYIEKLNSLIHKVELFGLHFATLDIRQDSSIHKQVFEHIVSNAKAEGKQLFPEGYLEQSEAEQIKFLNNIEGQLSPEDFDDEVVNKTLGSIYAMQTIQAENGERASNRYIISNSQKALHVMQAFTFLRLCDWKQPTADVVPLFETVPDLVEAPEVMEELYTNPSYLGHLKRRGMKQTIMLGFSDGTKDGGYLMANWSIFKAKEALTKISREHGVKVMFFDGRGGPPARGGGKTHQFYASLGSNIEAEEIQLTIQGQTISSNFGTLDSCQYNLEQLLSSGVANQVFASGENELSYGDRMTLQELADASYEAYTAFKKHPKFLPYLERMSTLKYYAKTNIGSRPSKRGKNSELVFSDLRAIPFVGSWSQLKQNVPGFYGVGTALEKFEKAGRLDEVKVLYKNNSFFRTLLENSMMSLTKSFFGLTAYMENDEEFGPFWKMIFEEYKRSKRLMLEVSGLKELMDNEEAGRASIQERERIVLPLLTIQQYALREIQKLQKENGDKKALETFEQMVTRSLFGNINASRNSA